MARKQVASALLMTVLGLTGCKNPCQQVCVRMADYAEECGFTVPQDQIEICIQDQGTVTADEKAACDDYGTPDAIRTEWACDDLEPYWSGGGGQEAGTAR